VLAQRYGQRPSAFVRGDPMDLQIDLASLVSSTVQLSTDDDETDADPAMRHMHW
jgi:hypothetical protein